MDAVRFDVVHAQAVELVGGVETDEEQPWGRRAGGMAVWLGWRVVWLVVLGIVARGGGKTIGGSPGIEIEKLMGSAGAERGKLDL
jgi:hypothetical protein